MKVKNYTQIPLLNGIEGEREQLGDLVRMTLQMAGYEVEGQVEVWNAHQVYAKVREGNELTAFAGILRFNKNLRITEVVGDVECYLDETTSSQLAHASHDFIKSLTNGKKIVNNEWRAKSVANATVIGRGTVVDIDKDARNITTDGTVLKRVVVTDGQKCTAAIAGDFTPGEERSSNNGRKMTFPRKTREVMTPDHSYLNINTFTIPHMDSRMRATELAIHFMQATSNEQITANLISGVKPGQSDSDVLIIYQGGQLKGSVAGDVVNLAIERMCEANASNGFKPQALMPVAKGVVVIDPEKLDKVFASRERKASAELSI